MLPLHIHPRLNQQNKSFFFLPSKYRFLRILLDFTNWEEYYSFMQTGYYKIFWLYIRVILVGFLAGLGLVVCFISKFIGCDWASETVVLCAFAGMFLLILGALFLLHYHKCPSCGKFSLKLGRDPVNIVSTEFVTQHFYVNCSHCDYFEYTDLGLKSNIFIKAIPVRMKSEDGADS